MTRSEVESSALAAAPASAQQIACPRSEPSKASFAGHDRLKGSRRPPGVGLLSRKQGLSIPL